MPKVDIEVSPPSESMKAGKMMAGKVKQGMSMEEVDDESTESSDELEAMKAFESAKTPEVKLAALKTLISMCMDSE
jgi:hypothetical protein